MAPETGGDGAFVVTPSLGLALLLVAILSFFLGATVAVVFLMEAGFTADNARDAAAVGLAIALLHYGVAAPFALRGTPASIRVDAAGVTVRGRLGGSRHVPWVAVQEWSTSEVDGLLWSSSFLRLRTDRFPGLRISDIGFLGPGWEGLLDAVRRHAAAMG
ncbi:MAG TPA: hypothetical protein VNZ52_08400, partial [Candidatus Thermoplasmatota archaeon]|nr:hypothetical protein [Candidatus Thermoplasmatota archaeon]